MRNVFLGFAYLWRGVKYIFKHRKCWYLLVVPALVNLMLLIFLVLVVVILLSYWLGMTLPEVWWATLISIMIVGSATVLVLFLGIMLFVSVGSIVAAPFYEALSSGVDQEVPRIDQPWWKEIALSFKNSLSKLAWFALIQVFLLIMLFIPFVVGMVTYTVVGFVAAVLFLALEYLDLVFDRRGVRFNDRLRWCLHHKWYVLGFGSAVFIGLTIPVVNLLVPPAAAVGAVLLFRDLQAMDSEENDLIFTASPLIR